MNSKSKKKFCNLINPVVTLFYIKSSMNVLNTEVNIYLSTKRHEIAYHLFNTISVGADASILFPRTSSSKMQAADTWWRFETSMTN